MVIECDDTCCLRLVVRTMGIAMDFKAGVLGDYEHGTIWKHLCAYILSLALLPTNISKSGYVLLHHHALALVSCAFCTKSRQESAIIMWP